jgi:hypothetical protein
MKNESETSLNATNSIGFSRIDFTARRGRHSGQRRLLAGELFKNR